MASVRAPEFFAHTSPGQPPERWQPLENHLRSVAEQAAAYAARFGAREWGYVAGLWHDLGKFSERFQSYLGQHGDYHEEEQSDGAIPSTDHTSAGAQHAVTAFPILGHLLAYVIAGHHAGLLDGISEGACLEKRLRKNVEPWKHGLEYLPEAPTPKLPPFLLKPRVGSDPKAASFSLAFFVRMLFSCLVDADFLDTECFMDPERAKERPKWDADILDRMEVALDGFVANLASDESLVNAYRRSVRESCLAAAERAPGLFSLTVPTGGGKTLSSLGFAIRHARLHELERIIYVIPFTTIVEQNADVFRRAFQPLVERGRPNPVLEHHSALDAGKETLASRLAAENWDAPLIVTTSVQFYESLFSNRPSRCRKLHNMTRSVIILDEAQKIPVDYLHPCLLALSELADNYGSSIVLCTATQPAVHLREDFPIGLQGVHEILTDTRKIFGSLKRVEVQDLGLLDEELPDLLKEHEQVMCIVNTRRHARELFGRVADLEGTFHLSAAMCAEHRARVLEHVRKRLETAMPCRVISTQLVEAGIDVDFPVVYRALAGLDSIAQAAGRCNRNGRRARGKMYLFRPRDPRQQKAETFLRDTINAASQVLGKDDVPGLFKDPLSLEAVEHYFRLYYWDQKARWDHERILDEFCLDRRNRKLPFQFAFRKVESRFHMIQAPGVSVIVPWEDQGQKLVDQLRRSSREIPLGPVLRRLQRYAVEIPRRLFQREIGRSIEMVLDRYPVLISPELHYDCRLGMVLDREDHAAEVFMI